MKPQYIKILRWYYHLYYFIAAKRLIKGDLDVRSIHQLVVCVLTTGIFMWGYAYLAFVTISSPIPGIVGFICATVHLMSPLLLRISNQHFLICNITLGTGLIHQWTFSYFTGGFMSETLRWFPILPLLAGLIVGKRGAILWGIITTICSMIFLWAQINGYQFPNLITAEGKFIAVMFIQFGFILICAIVICIANTMQESAENQLKDQRKRIDDLFKVLFHDLANPLGRLGIGLNSLKKQILPGTATRGMEIVSEATESMLEITQNVRKIYAISKGKVNMDLMPTSLTEAVDYLHQHFGHEFKEKQIRLIYDREKNAGLRLLVEPVSFKSQVLANVLSNAIKFSEMGSAIYIDVTPLPDSNFMISIRDEGVGVPKHIIPHLFDLEKHTNRSGTKGENGTGFGLLIMKSFVEMYGGEITVSSIEKGEGSPSGTTFSITLHGLT